MNDINAHQIDKPILVERLRDDDNFSARFVEGVGNVLVDIRLKDDDQLLRMWLSCFPQPLIDESNPKFSVSVVGDRNEKDETPRIVLAEMGVEDRTDVHKHGACTFVSLQTQKMWGIMPPFWWTFVQSRLTEWLRRRQDAGGDAGAAEARRRAITTPELLERLAAVRVSIHPYGVGVVIENDTIEFVDSQVGPFNSP